MRPTATTVDTTTPWGSVVNILVGLISVDNATVVEEQPQFPTATYGMVRRLRRFARNGFEVRVEICYYESWVGKHQPTVAMKGFAPNAEGELRPVWAVEEKYGHVTPGPQTVSDTVDEILTLLEKDYQPQDKALVKAKADEVATPEGWTRTEAWGSMYAFGEQWGNETSVGYFVSFMSPEEDVRITLNWAFHEAGSDHIEFCGGHTDFKSTKGWLSFTRRGIDNSFSLGEWAEHDMHQANEAVASQITRARKSLSEYQQAVVLKVGGGSFTLTPKRLQGIKDLLSGGGRAQVAPGGMGTGYVLSTTRFPGRYGSEASAEAASLLGVRRLYWQRFDHD